MKLILAVCLLAGVAAGQETPQGIQTQDDVSSLRVSFLGVEGGKSRIRISNTSSHAVTAFSLRLVPAGIPVQDGHYLCEGQCGRSFTIADNSSPAIKAGSSVDRAFSVDSVGGGAVLAEAAIFDDESYEGKEDVAAFLVSRQIGNQAEYDRIVSAVQPVISSTTDDAQKTVRIRMALGSLPVNLDPAMIRTFKAWFPDLEDCDHSFAREMKKAATGEKQIAIDSIELFAHGSKRPSVSQWWDSAKLQLAGFGCDGCANQASHPKPPASPQNASMQCRNDAVDEIILSASLVDDGSDMDQGDETAEGELAPEDMAALAEDRGPEKTKPVARSAASAPARGASRAEYVAPPSLVRKGPPSGLGFTHAPDGNGYLLWRIAYDGPVADSFVYRAFFLDVTRLGDRAFYEVVRWSEDGDELRSGQPAGGLTASQLETVKKISDDCEMEMGKLFLKRTSLMSTQRRGYPLGWAAYMPPLQGERELKDKETIVLNAHIDQLRTRLGQNSFSRLDGFVRKVYHAVPGRTVTIPLPDDFLYGSFFRYIAVLDQLSVGDQEKAKQETAKRHNELIAAGLDEKQWLMLKKVALDYNLAYSNLYNDRLLGAVPFRGPLPGNSPGIKPGVVTPAAAAEQRAAQGKLNLLASIAQLQAGLGDPLFQKFDAYLHLLYAPATRETFVAASASAADVRSAKQQ